MVDRTDPPADRTGRSDDPSDDLTGRSDGGDDQITRCTVCGSTIDPTNWHPATTSVDADGTVHVLVFCSEDCREVRRDD